MVEIVFFFLKVQGVLALSVVAPTLAFNMALETWRLPMALSWRLAVSSLFVVYALMFVCMGALVVGEVLNSAPQQHCTATI